LSAGAVSFIVENLLREEKEKHAAVLVYLLYAGQALEVELRRAMTGGRYLADARTASKVIEELVLMNLVERSSVGARYKLYKLTELGRAVAEELKRSQKLEIPVQPVEVQPVETAPLAQPEAAGGELLQAPAAPAGAAEALRWVRHLTALSVLIEAMASAHGVDVQPLTRRLLMEAANLLRGAGLGEEAARLEEVAMRFREPSAGEVATVEEALARIRAALARSGLKPLDPIEVYKIVQLFEKRSTGAR
jgi:DNA-binding MarR family transcriptional regulator